MKKFKLHIIPVYLPVVVVLLLFMACDYDRNTTGWAYADDMDNSTAYETYSDNPVLEDGMTMQPPVAGTIPRGMIPYPYEKTDEDRAQAAAILENPLELNPFNIERGKQQYNVYCMHCHGENGNGQGSLYTSKKYGYPPASLLSDKMTMNNEAEIYHVITVGFGVMGEHGSLIRPDDRWRIAMYVKEVLQQ